MTEIKLNFYRFFHYFLFHTKHKNLSPTDQKTAARWRGLCWLSGGLIPLFCRIFLYNKNLPSKWIPQAKTTATVADKVLPKPLNQPSISSNSKSEKSAHSASSIKPDPIATPLQTPQAPTLPPLSYIEFPPSAFVMQPYPFLELKDMDLTLDRTASPEQMQKNFEILRPLFDKIPLAGFEQFRGNHPAAQLYDIDLMEKKLHERTFQLRSVVPQYEERMKSLNSNAPPLQVLLKDLEDTWDVSGLRILLMSSALLGTLTYEQISQMSARQLEILQARIKLESAQITPKSVNELNDISKLTLAEIVALTDTQLDQKLPQLPTPLLKLLTPKQLENLSVQKLSVDQKNELFDSVQFLQALHKTQLMSILEDLSKEQLLNLTHSQLKQLDPSAFGQRVCEALYSADDLQNDTAKKAMIKRMHALTEPQLTAARLHLKSNLLPYLTLEQFELLDVSTFTQEDCKALFDEKTGLDRITEGLSLLGFGIPKPLDRLNSLGKDKLNTLRKFLGIKHLLALTLDQFKLLDVSTFTQDDCKAFFDTTASFTRQEALKRLHSLDESKLTTLAPLLTVQQLKALTIDQFKMLDVKIFTKENCKELFDLNSSFERADALKRLRSLDEGKRNILTPLLTTQQLKALGLAQKDSGTEKDADDPVGCAQQ